MNKFIWGLIIIAIIAAAGIIFLYWYPASPLAERKFLTAEILPVQMYNQTMAGSKCGAHLMVDGRAGIRNSIVAKCHEQAMADCSQGVALYIKQDSNRTQYSFFRMLGRNEQGDCVFQNTYYEQIGVDSGAAWSNSCAQLAADRFSSCQPAINQN